jgi:hypothetical protein
VRNQAIHRADGFAGAALPDRLNQQIESRFGHLRDRLMDRGQLRPNGRCGRGVVESDDRQVPGHIEPPAMRD